MNNLKLERQTATYKIKYGLAKLEHQRLVNTMKNNSFSLNIDESTSKSSKERVLNILVSYFCEQLQKPICNLYASIEMTVVNAQTVFEAVRDQFASDNIPLLNLVSVLTDSANYMRGEHNGFQSKLREANPQILDIDGDICHHIHNAVKKFSSLVDPSKVLNSLLDDVYNDLDYSADLREDLKKISKNLGLDEKTPIKRAGHRWLSIYDSSLRFLEILDSLTLFYSAWLTHEEKKEEQSWQTVLKRLRTKKKELNASQL